MDAVKQYFSGNRERFLEELFAFLRIPSVSLHSKHKADVQHAAEWLAEALTKAGMEHVEIIRTEGHPVVYADWLHAEGKPTALIYGHYDVQPPDPLEQWESPPFEPEIRDGKLFARGTTDDKAQVFIHVKTVEALLGTYGSLPINIKFCIEGEEEIASPHLAALIEGDKNRFQADAVVISDSAIFAKDYPGMDYGLRGLCAVKIDVTGAKNDLHSGEFGGAVPNAVHALSDLLSSFHDSAGKITVEGFYDQVRELGEEERKLLNELPFDEQSLRQELRVPGFHGEEGYSYRERTWIRPTLEINAVSGGSQDEGIKPIVPAHAWAKISCRLVPDQTPDEILAKIERHVCKHAPAYVDVKVTRLPIKGNPYVAALDDPFIEAAAAAYAGVYGQPPVFTRSGGSIPIVEAFNRLLHIPVVLMGFGLPDENLHAPNENFLLDNFDKGLLTMAAYWQRLGAIPTK